MPAVEKESPKIISDRIEQAIDRMPHLDSASRAWFVRQFELLRASLK